MAKDTSTSPYAKQQLGLTNLGALSKAMREQSLSPIENVGGPRAALSWTQVLGKLMQAHMANKVGEEHAAETEALNKQMLEDRKAGVTKLYEGLKGEDPHSAIFEAMMHHDPIVSGIGKEEYKGRVTPKDLAKKATGASVIANPNNPQSWQAKQKLTSLTPGHVTVDESGKGVNVDFASGAAPKMEEIGGDKFQVSSTGWKKLDNAPKVSSNVTVNLPPGQLGETEFEKKFGGDQGKALSKFVVDRPAHLNAIDAANHGLSLLEKGIHSGALAKLAKGADKASIALFKTDPAIVNRTEEFMEASAQQVLSALQQIGGNDSNEDRKYLQGVLGGDITLEPETLKGIMKRTIQRSRRDIGTGDKAIENYKSRGKTIPTIDFDTLPQPGEDFNPQAQDATGQPAISLEEYIRRTKGAQ